MPSEGGGGVGGIKRKREGKKKKTHRNVSGDLASFRLLSPECPGSHLGSQREGGHGRPRDGGKGENKQGSGICAAAVTTVTDKGLSGRGPWPRPPPPWGWGGGRDGSGRPGSRGGSEGSRRLGEAISSRHGDAVPRQTPLCRACLSVQRRQGCSQGGREGEGGRLFSAASGGWVFDSLPTLFLAN